jgi:TonB family protein
MPFLRLYVGLPFLLLSVASAHYQEIAMPKCGAFCEISNTTAWPWESDDFIANSNAPSQSVDTEPDINFGPYIEKLKRRIRRNWVAPENKNSRCTILQFFVLRDGSVSGLRIVQSSGSPALDQVALDAVSQASPFDPLPDAYQGDSVEINFTFDVNVFGSDLTPL